MNDARALAHRALSDFMLVCLVASMVKKGAITPADIAEWTARGVRLLSAAGTPGGPPLSFPLNDADREDFRVALREAADGAAATLAYVLGAP